MSSLEICEIELLLLDNNRVKPFRLHYFKIMIMCVCDVSPLLADCQPASAGGAAAVAAVAAVGAVVAVAAVAAVAAAVAAVVAVAVAAAVAVAGREV